ncbi:hypothetical protein GH5_08515 [Leishmania sp. Ghana 2012 LV757]|uniref:hypothetical protein n=1 Tax=Leishmania sp. Ghana 2012 LV757 TaxID=2803181 RepID=UPI001B5CD675|nr:hypothetical protein GH5_08515 [Leishmania sp. Ghana 2012 LV757]
MTGGCVRCMLGGAGPMNAPTQSFMNAIFGELAISAGPGKQKMVRYVPVADHQWTLQTDTLTATGRIKCHVVA